MTTQAVTAYVNTPTNGKIFSVTATDGTWANPMVNNSNDIGQVMAGSTITNVSLTYAAGCCIGRIQDRNTLVVKRVFTGSKSGETDWNLTAIQPYTVQANDILVCYPLPKDATANQSSCLAWLTMGNNQIAFGATDVPDSTTTEIKSLVNEQSLGTYYNQNLSSIKIQMEDDCVLSLVTLIDPNGGTIISIPATVRDAGHYYFNLKASGLKIPILKGTVMNIVAVTG